MDQNVAVDGWPTFEVNKRTKKGARIVRVNDSDMQKCPSHLGHWVFFILTNPAGIIRANGLIYF